MSKINLALLTILLTLGLSGCGTTNMYQWAAPRPDHDNLEQARAALDEANYDKALALVSKEQNPEGRIIYAEALLGKSGIDLAAIINALDEDKATDPYQKGKPILLLEKLVLDPEISNTALTVGDIFIANQPSKTADKVIGTIGLLLAHTANLKQAFSPNASLTDYVKSLNNDDIDVSENYKNLGANPIRYITRAVELLDSGEESLKEAVASANAAIVMINDTVSFLDEVITKNSTTQTVIRLDDESTLDYLLTQLAKLQDAGVVNGADIKFNENAVRDAIKNVGVSEIPLDNTKLPADLSISPYRWGFVQKLFGLD